MGSRSVFLSLLFLLSLLLLSFSASASAGIRGQASFSWKYVPGQEYATSFDIYGAESLNSFLGGDLAQYAKLRDPDPGGGPRRISVTLRLPEGLAPGQHVLYVGTKEARPEGAMVGGVAAAKRVIWIQVLYPDPLLSATLEVEDIAVNTSFTIATVSVHSLTTQTLTNVYADILLQDQDGGQITSVRSSFKEVASDATETFEVKLPTASLSPGPYRALAVVHYGKNETNASATFRVGTLEFSLDSYPQNLTVDAVNRFAFTVSSNWNQPLDNVYGTVDVASLSEKTPGVSVGPFGTAELKTYLDTTGIALGSYDGNITLSYPGGTQRFPIFVTIVNEPLAETELEAQEPSAFTALFAHPLILLYIGLILLVILNLVLLFQPRRPKEELRPPR